MNYSKLEVAIVHSDSFPETIIKAISDEVSDENVSLTIQEYKNGPMASLEWFIPTAFALWILKPYTETILSEMAKDNYQLVKKIILAGANKLIGKGRMVSVHVITSTNAPQKARNKYSITFSVLMTLSSKYRIKFLFDDSLSKEELEDYAGKIAEFMLSNSDDAIMEIIRANGNIAIMNMGICSYNSKEKEIIVLDVLKDRN